MRTLTLTFLLSALTGCAVRDGSKSGEAPIWYPAFIVRDANTTGQWGGQDIYNRQTNRVDPKKQPSIGGLGTAQPVNPPDSLHASAGGNGNDPSRFYVAGRSIQQPTASHDPFREGLRPPGAATLYPTRGNAAQSAGSPTLYPPSGSFRTDDPSKPSVYPNGATGERGYIGK